MDCDALRDDQWERLKSFVPGGTKDKRGPRTDNRKFLDALLWMAPSCVPTSTLPVHARQRGADARGPGRSRGGLSTKSMPPRKRLAFRSA